MTELNEGQVVTLVSSFLGGFAMTWLRGFSWFGDSTTYLLAFIGGTLCTSLLGAHTPIEWMLGIMSHTLTVLGAVHVGGGGARVREARGIPAAVLPKFNELSNPPTPKGDQ